ncbi:sensor histidine kinase [Microbulbifer guangxiensis]|uniref:sensor histidine kinase n=1 Tax=Microbulbifer guangxiensis TaxID=2904249 RepID=UPI001F343122|nr:HAMP domain-containing sensor histidine kinase [Microbulbifer guangxiensis]
MRGQMLRLLGLMALALVVVFSAISALHQQYSSGPDDYTISATQLAQALERSEGALVQTYPLHAVHFPGELMSRLKSGATVGLDDDNQQIRFYRLSGDQVMEIGPFSQPQAASVTQWRLLFIGTMLLVLLLLIWPMFRDLNRLQNLAIRFSKKPFRMPAPTSRRSTIYPLAETFRRMSNIVLGYCQMSQDLARTIAHEIRTPLARIKFQLALDDKGAESKQVVTQAVSDIEQLVDKYLSFSRLEIHEEFISRRRVCLETFFDDLAPSLESHCPELELGYYFPDGEAWFEPDALAIAIQNLVSNARKYADNRVDLRFDYCETRCQLTVEDNGPGLGGDALELTDAFTRSATDEQGYGLGLYIVKKVMMWHDGELRLGRSPTLGGTRATLSWPNSP